MPDQPFFWSDGWLLVTLCAAAKPIDRVRLNAIGDALNHAIFMDEEVEGGMTRLSAAGYAYITDDGLYCASEAGKEFVKAHQILGEGHIANMFRVIDAITGENRPRHNV